MKVFVSVSKKARQRDETILQVNTQLDDQRQKSRAQSTCLHLPLVGLTIAFVFDPPTNFEDLKQRHIAKCITTHDSTFIKQ